MSKLEIESVIAMCVTVFLIVLMAVLMRGCEISAEKFNACVEHHLPLECAAAEKISQ